MVWLQRRVLFRGERRKSTLRVSVALAPTLVFTLVLAEILHSRFGISGALSGALILYTTLNTLLPSLVLRMPFDVDPISSEEHTSELQSLMRSSYAVFCLQKKHNLLSLMIV